MSLSPRIATTLLALLCSTGHSAWGAQMTGASTTQASAAALQQQVRTQLESRLPPGQTRLDIGTPDMRNVGAPCAQLDVLLPPPERLRGRVQVGLRCDAPQQWATWVPVSIVVNVTYWVAAHALPSGTVVQASDLVPRSGDASALPRGAVQHPDEAVGRILMTRLAEGAPLTAHSLRQQVAVQAGQSVKLLVDGGTFQISSDGRALNQAMQGQVAQVRTASGNVVRGIASAGGVVRVQY